MPAAVTAQAPYPASALAEVVRLAVEDVDALDARRRLSVPVARALASAGFARHFVPRAYGGSAGTFTALLDAVATVGETCASTAWCAGLYAAHGRLASFLPRQGREELWRDGPDVRIAASVVPPQGEALAVADGWLLSGQWIFASGVDHADWVLLASRTPGAEEAGHRIFAVPRSELSIVDTWHSVGLCGTGSNAVVAHQVHVPRHRSFSVAALGRAAEDAARCHRVPYAMVGSLVFAMPALGGARGALEAWQRWTATRPATGGQPAARQQAFARASAQILAAELLLRTAAARADDGPTSPLESAANRRDAAVAVELCVEAVDHLWRSMGASALGTSDPLQRRWRDLVALSSHAALGFDAAAAAYAEAVLG